MKALEIRKFLSNLRNRYISYPEAVKRFFINRKRRYKIISLEDVRNNYKKSDTIFIIGSGPSILDFTSQQWRIIRQHDSFGINYSFLLDFIPTYHSLEDNRTYWGRVFFRRFMRERFYSRRTKYKNTIMFISEKHTQRFIHPRFVPELFPHQPVVCKYKYPPVINLKEGENFSEKHFQTSLVYRGSLSVVLHLVNELGYKNIVLLGIDLHTPKHFFDDFSEMNPYIEKIKKIHGDEHKYESMIPKEGKAKTMEEYIYALDGMYFKKKNVSLYVGNRDNLLFPKIKYYNWSEQ